MTTKKVSIGAKPTSSRRRPPLMRGVESRAPVEGPEPMKRLTIDVPMSLHRAIKSQCAMRGTKIADEVRELLVQNTEIRKNVF
jgi:plasmid segregation centromere-binding protein ParG